MRGVAAAALLGAIGAVSAAVGQYSTAPDSSQQYATKIVESKIPVLIDFWAPWCGPCHMIAPSIAQLEKEYKGRITVMRINIDMHREIADYFQVQSIPIVFLVKDKAVVKFVPGAQPKEAYKRAIEEVLVMKVPADTSASEPKSAAKAKAKPKTPPGDSAAAPNSKTTPPDSL